MPFAGEHPVFTTPPDEAVLWRYLDSAKLTSLLERGELWFPSAAALGDPFEGSFSRANLESSLAEIPEASRAEARNNLARFRRYAAGHTFISCWHENAVESAAMWRLYLKSDEGVAISTTAADLKSSLADAPQDIYLGRVRYIDYDSDPMPADNTFWPFVHKRRSFEHEREVRAVIADYRLPVDYTQPDSAGTYVPVDTEVLVGAVHVAPGTPDWFLEVVESVLRRYASGTTVHRSRLSEDPVF